MPAFWESFRVFIAKVLGMGTDEERRIAQLRHKEVEFETTIRDNNENIEQLKQKIRALEMRAVQLKKEMDQTSGDRKRLVISQIEQTFRELKLLEGQENVILGNLDRNQLALAKLREVITSLQAGGATQDVLDDLALDIGQTQDDMKQADKAAAALDKERYQRPQHPLQDESSSVAERAAKLEEAERKSAPALSAEIEHRLKQLESAEE